MADDNCNCDDDGDDDDDDEDDDVDDERKVAVWLVCTRSAELP